MITKPVSKAELAAMKKIRPEKKDSLVPCRKTGEEIERYLRAKYPLAETKEEKFLNAVSGNVLENEFEREKFGGALPRPKAFFLLREGAGAPLYEKSGCERIFVGLDLETGFFLVEGSPDLWDELCAFRGLDEKDLQNYVCTAVYFSCLEKQKEKGE